jgi:endonuclease/exonuclease/phosphatase family metal-dependent hydrolase
MGDMNDIMHPNEKSGPRRPNLRRINAFYDHVKHCGLIDLGYNGPTHTWNNKCFTIEPTFQRLDRCLANAEWCTAYPRTTVYHLPMLCSDHAPILTVLNSTRQKLTNLSF